MIVSVVVCPAAPLLIPGLADAAGCGLEDLRAACLGAIDRLRSMQQVLLIGTGPTAPATAGFGPGTVVSAADLARSDLPVVAPVTLPGGARVSSEAEGRPPVGVGQLGVAAVVGAYLLAAAGLTVPTWALPVDPTDPTSIRGGAASVLRTGLLVVADGAACHGPDAPGARDDRSAGFDAAIAGALAAGSPTALAAVVRDRAVQAAELRCTGLPAFAAMAALTADAPPTTGRVDYCAAPLGVGYFVAAWQWD